MSSTISTTSVKSRSSRTGAGRCCVPLLGPQSTHFAALSVSPCRRCSKNSHAPEPQSNPLNLWCLSRREASIALFYRCILKRGAEVGLEKQSRLGSAFKREPVRYGLFGSMDVCSADRTVSSPRPQSSPHFADFGIAQGKNQEELKPFGNESWWSSLGSSVAFLAERHSLA